MKNMHIPESITRWAGVGLVLMAASQPSAAIGGAGALESCATFTLSAAGNPFPSTFTLGVSGSSNCGDGSWNLKVRDVNRLSIGDHDQVTSGPTLAARK